jgi:anaerobic selenocysteine-containing dehydrogenase
MGEPMAAAFAWDDYPTCLEETLGDKWDTLSEEGFWLEDGFAAADWPEAFETESAKFEFSSHVIQELPSYKPVTAPGDDSFYPLLLIPYDTMRLTDGYIGSSPFMVKSLEATILKGNAVLVEINPATAKKLGLGDGKFATLTTPVSSARVKVHFSNGIMPGVIAIPRGLGHTAYDKFLSGKGVNYNSLSTVVADPATGFDAAWGIRAKLSRA